MRGWVSGRPLFNLAIAIACAITLLCSVTAPNARAQGSMARPSGGVYIPIKDGLPRQCVNINKDLVSFFIIAVKARQNTSFLPNWVVSTSKLGVKVNVTMVDNATQNPAFTFPRAIVLRPITSSSIYTLPIDYEILTKYDLINTESSPPSPIASFSFDLDFVDMEQKTAIATEMLSLVRFTQYLPTPAKPFAPGVGLLGQFVNDLFNDAAGAASSDVAPVAARSYDLSTSDSCGPRELTEGTAGVIFDYPNANMSGVIRTSEVDSYCFSITSTQSVEYRRKTDLAEDCDHQKAFGSPEILNNPQIIYAINIYPKPGAVRLTRSLPTTSDRRPNQAELAQIKGLLNPSTQKYVADALSAGPFETGAFNAAAAAQPRVDAWSKALTGTAPVPDDLLSGRLSPSSAILSAPSAAEYDATRAAARCLVLDIPLPKCL
jgi:hypothetical protein